MSRGGRKKPMTATEMFRESIRPYSNLYEFYKACKEADTIIHCNDKQGREVTFATGMFAQLLGENHLINNKLNKV